MKKVIKVSMGRRGFTLLPLGTPHKECLHEGKKGIISVIAVEDWMGDLVSLPKRDFKTGIPDLDRGRHFRSTEEFRKTEQIFFASCWKKERKEREAVTGGKVFASLEEAQIDQVRLREKASGVEAYYSGDGFQVGYTWGD